MLKKEEVVKTFSPRIEACMSSLYTGLNYRNKEVDFFMGLARKEDPTDKGCIQFIPIGCVQ